MGELFSWWKQNSSRLIRRCASRFLFKRYLIVLESYIPRFGFFWIFLVAVTDFFIRLVSEFFLGNKNFKGVHLWLEGAALEYFRLRIVVRELGWCISSSLRCSLFQSFCAVPSFLELRTEDGNTKWNSCHKLKKKSSHSHAKVKKELSNSESSVSLCFRRRATLFFFSSIFFFLWCYWPPVCFLVVLIAVTALREGCSLLPLGYSRSILQKKKCAKIPLIVAHSYWLHFGRRLDSCIVVLWLSGVAAVTFFHSGALDFFFIRTIFPFFGAFTPFFSNSLLGLAGLQSVSLRNFRYDECCRAIFFSLIGGLCVSLFTLRWLRNSSFTPLIHDIISKQRNESSVKQSKKEIVCEAHFLTWRLQDYRTTLDGSKKKSLRDQQSRSCAFWHRWIWCYVLVASVWTFASAFSHIFSNVFPFFIQLSISLSGAILLSILTFWVFPPVLAKFLCFSFLREVTELKIGGFLDEFYTSKRAQLSYPCFLSPLFVFTVNAVVGKFFNVIGVFLFFVVFWKCNYRIAFFSIILLVMVGTLFSRFLVLSHWSRYSENLEMGVAPFLKNTGMSKIPFFYSWLPSTFSDTIAYVLSTIFLQLSHALTWIPFGVMQDALLPPVSGRYGKSFLIFQSLASLYMYFGMSVCSDLTKFINHTEFFRLRGEFTTDSMGYDVNRIIFLTVFASLLPGLSLLPLVWWSVPGKVLVGAEVDYPGKQELMIPLSLKKLQ